MTADSKTLIADRLWTISENLLRLEQSDLLDYAVEELCDIVFELSMESSGTELQEVLAVSAH